MANEDQINSILSLMQQQMSQIQALQAENNSLRGGRVNARTKAPDRPIVNSHIDEREWELFKDGWDRYKTMSGITEGDMVRIELRAACSPEVNKMLFEFVGSDALKTADENQLLSFIRALP